MVRITSLANPFIVTLSTLHTRKGRKAEGMFLAEGLRTCTSLIASPLQLEKLIVTDELLPEARVLVSEDNIVVVPEKVMKKISTATTPSGMVGVFHIPPQPCLETLTSGIVCARLMDPGNMGTLVRTAVAFNYRSVVVVEGVDPWNPKTVQATAGTLGNVSLFCVSWEEFRAYTTRHGYELSALVVRGGSDPRTRKFSERHLFVVGGEAEGIPETWINECDHRITLPMPGNAESLNAAVAGSLALALGYWEK